MLMPFWMRSIAEGLERLIANAVVCPGFDPSILRHSRILGAADEAVLNKEQTKMKKIKFIPF
jgi:hypothetical protein